MASKPVALLLTDLGEFTPVSMEDPLSESQFKALGYRPDFPERFGSIGHAGAFCRVQEGFRPWLPGPDQTQGRTQTDKEAERSAIALTESQQRRSEA